MTADSFYLSPSELSMAGGKVTHNTSHIRLGTGVTEIPMHLGITIERDTNPLGNGYPIWGLDGLGWTRYSTPAISGTSLDTRAYGSAVPPSNDRGLIVPGRFQTWSDDDKSTFDSDDSLLYLTTDYTGTINIPEVNPGAGGTAGIRMWNVSNGPVLPGSAFAQGMVELESDIWSRDWMAIGGTLATVHRISRFFGVVFPGQPARWNAVCTQLQLLTPVLSGGELYLREEYYVASQQFGYTFKIPALTLNYVLAVGGFD